MRRSLSASLDVVSGDGVDVVVGAVGPGGSCAVGFARSNAPIGALLLASIMLIRARRRRAPA
jgi:MYXO-CTERM domain-containing protein